MISELQEHLKPSYLIVDGLDECLDDVTKFLQCCRKISTKWHILIMSRDVPEIRNGLQMKNLRRRTLTLLDNQKDQNSSMAHRAITVYDTKQDIENVVNRRTEELAETKSWQAFQSAIAQTINTNAKGLFLWVQLVLDFLLDETTMESDVDSALAVVPSKLDEIYDRILQKTKADSGRWKIAQICLIWIIHSSRPLTANELHAAVAFQINSSKPINNFEEIFRSSCGLLVRLDDASKKITIIHATVKDYLMKPSDAFGLRIVDAEAAQATISATCLSYLCTKLRYGIPVDQNAQKSAQCFKDRLESPSNQLLEYSVLFWIPHLLRSPGQSRKWQQPLIQFVRSEDYVVNWLQLSHYLIRCDYPGAHEALNHASQALNQFFEKEQLQNVNNSEREKLSSFQNHLGLGSGNRFSRWDRLEHVDDDYPECLPIVLIAAHFNFIETIKREIRRRADFTAQSYGGGKVLVWAARGDGLDAVKYILSQEVTRAQKSQSDYEATLAEALVETISPGRHGFNNSGTYPVVEVLLDAGAIQKWESRPHGNPLQILIDSNNTDGDGEISVTKLLLNNSPDLWKSHNDQFGSVLHHAVGKGKCHILCAILQEIRAQNPEVASRLQRNALKGILLCTLHFE